MENIYSSPKAQNNGGIKKLELLYDGIAIESIISLRNSGTDEVE